MHNWMKLKLF